MELLYLGLGIKRVLASTALVQHDTKSPDVRLLIVWLALAQLRGDVVRCADQGLGKTFWAGKYLNYALHYGLWSTKDRKAHSLVTRANRRACHRLHLWQKRANSFALTFCYCTATSSMQNCQHCLISHNKQYIDWVRTVYRSYAQVSNFDVSVCV